MTEKSIFFLIFFISILLNLYSQTTFNEAVWRKNMSAENISDTAIINSLLKEKKAEYLSYISNSYNKTVMVNDTNSDCYNIDFETNSLSGWTGYTGSNTNSQAAITNPVYGIVAGRQTIVTGSGTDLYGGFPLVAPGGSYSARVGNAGFGAQAEQLQQTFKVSKVHPYVIYRYAVVLNDNSHSAFQQPYLLIYLKDGNNDTIPCTTYYVSAAANIPGFKTATLAAGFDVNNLAPVRYKSWSSIAVDLTNYVDQYVTIVFTTGDCEQTGHFGYAYVDVSCDNLGNNYFCPGDSAITYIAPDGFKTYKWFDAHGTLLDSTQNITIQNPQLGDKFEVELIPITTNDISCALRLKKTVVLNPYPIVVDYKLIQNIFTPNGDGKNDTFKTTQFQHVNDFSISIYNRWGLLVFKSSDFTKEWDGTLNGQNASDGVYYWMASYSSSCETTPIPIKSKGFVHLIR